MNTELDETKELKKSAENGDPLSQLQLGITYKKLGDRAPHRFAVQTEEYIESVKWFRMAAEQDNADACVKLGVAYNYGEGVAQDYEEAVRWYKKSLEIGKNADAELHLGECYYFGWGVPQDEEKAQDLYKSASEGGSYEATCALYFGAHLYPDGRGVSTDDQELLTKAEQGDAEAQYRIALWYRNLGYQAPHRFAVHPDAYIESIKWLRMAAEQGNSDACFTLGFAYNFGEGVDQNYEEAVRWYKKSIEIGKNTDAEYHLGECYHFGWGVPQDEEKAKDLYKSASEGDSYKATCALNDNDHFYYDDEWKHGVSADDQELLRKAEQGDAEAQYRIGVWYSSHAIGYLGKEYPDANALKWYRMAAEQGHERAIYSVGYEYALNENYEEAAKWFRKAAELGDSTAQFTLGKYYAEGKGVERDYEMAVYWYKRAAWLGNECAQVSLADCYYAGIGVEQDYEEAFEWYRAAAYEWNDSAKIALANCYYAGIGVEQDYKEAVEWYLCVIDLKYPYPSCCRERFRLAKCYRLGLGVEKDLEMAEKWLQSAKEAVGQCNGECDCL